MESVIMVPFRGEGAGVDRLTWGQREVWAAIRSQGASLVVGGVIPFPVGMTVEFATAALRYIVGRHQSLRTRLRFEPDGEVRQVVSESGEVPLEIVDVAADENPAVAAAAVAERYEAVEFDYADEWPVRMAVIRHRGVGTHLVAMYCHLALDVEGFDALVADLQAAVARGLDLESTSVTPASDAIQPLEQARWQRSIEGLRQNETVQRYWRRRLAGVSSGRFGVTDDERGPRHWQAIYRSRAAFLAMTPIAQRVRTDTSAVLIAAGAVSLARITGRNPTVFQVVAGNRFRPGFAGTVSPIAQSSLCVIDAADVTFDEVVARTWRCAMGAYMHAYYDRDRMDAMIARLAADRGEEVDVACFFNDRCREERRKADGPIPTPAELAVSLDEHELRWGVKSDKPFERFFAHISDVEDVIEIVMYADTRYLPPGDMQAFLEGFEWVLVASAFDATVPTGVVFEA